MKKFRDAAYVRVSTPEQAQNNNSVPYQKDRIETESKRCDGGTFACFEESGKSAWDAPLGSRPQMMELLRRCAAGEFDRVWFLDLKRLARDLDDQIYLLKQFTKNGVEPKFINHPSIDLSTANGKMMANLLGTVNQYESDQKSEEAPKRMRNSAKSKGILQWCTPAGYRKDAHGRIQLDKRRADLMRTAFDMAAQGFAVPEICKSLNQAGWTEPRGNRAGKPVIATSLHKRLRSEVYKGLVVSEERRGRDNKKRIRQIGLGVRVKGNFPAIVTEALWKKAQAALDRANGSYHVTMQQTAEHWLFRGVIACPDCDAQLRKHLTVYVPSKYKNKPNARRSVKCPRSHVHFSEERCYELFDEYLQRLTVKPSELREFCLTIDELALEGVSHHKKAVRVIRGNVERNIAEQKTLIGEIAKLPDGSRKKIAFNRKLDELLETELTLSEQLKEAEKQLESAQNATAIKAYAVELLGAVSNWFAASDTNTKRDLVHAVAPDGLIIENNAYRTKANHWFWETCDEKKSRKNKWRTRRDSNPRPPGP